MYLFPVMLRLMSAGLRVVLQESEVTADGAVGDELVERFRTITERLQSLKLETDEVVCFKHFSIV